MGGTSLSPPHSRASELAPDRTVDGPAEFALGSLDLLLGSLPPVASRRRGGLWAKGIAGVGDGVIEAVGFDALGSLLPRASRARLIRRQAESGQ